MNHICPNKKVLPNVPSRKFVGLTARLRQDNNTATEYIEQFEKFRIRSDATEDESITLSRFRKCLNCDLQREMVAREISTLDNVYDLVQNFELIPRPQSKRRFENRMLPHNNLEAPQGSYFQGNQSRPYLNNRPLRIDDIPQGRY